MNVLNLHNYQSILLNPISYEQNFFFYLNFPGLLYAAYIIEKGMGSRVLIGAYLMNCTVSALSTAFYHRQINIIDLIIIIIIFRVQSSSVERKDS